jgi:hypothetical protein
MIQSPQRSGFVRMDQFEADATWDNADGKSIVVKFKGGLLSRQKNRELEHFRSCTRAFVLRVPGQRERRVSVVGYSIPDNAFYLAWL